MPTPEAVSSQMFLKGISGKSSANLTYVNWFPYLTNRFADFRRAVPSLFVDQLRFAVGRNVSPSNSMS